MTLEEKLALGCHTTTDLKRAKAKIKRRKSVKLSDGLLTPKEAAKSLAKIGQLLRGSGR